MKLLPALRKAALGACFVFLGAAASAQGATVPGEAVFARVGGKTIALAEYEQALAAAMRQKFYHGKPPEAQVEALQREVAQRMIDRVLLLDEAKRRGLTPDAAEVDKTIAGYEDRYKASPMWQSRRAELLPGLREQLGTQDLLQQIERTTRAVPKPTAAEVRTFYKQRPELFTEPEKLRLSVILLKVDPSSTKVVWQKAEEEAGAIVARLAKGAEFAELAKLHSGDGSAAKGGDMGYLHRGMLPEGLHEQIDSLQIGKPAGPIRVLEGVGVFRLDEKVPAALRAFEAVSSRAAELLLRERSDKAWANLLDSLRSRSAIRIETDRYPALGKIAQGG